MLYHHCLLTLLQKYHKAGSGKPRWLEIDGTNELLVYANDINILGKSIHIIKKNTEALVVASKEIGLKANVEKTK
jgi:hypothetical protein